MPLKIKSSLTPLVASYSKNKTSMLVAGVHTCNRNIQEAEAGETSLGYIKFFN